MKKFWEKIRKSGSIKLTKDLWTLCLASAGFTIVVAIPVSAIVMLIKWLWS